MVVVKVHKATLRILPSIYRLLYQFIVWEGSAMLFKYLGTVVFGGIPPADISW